MRNSTTYTTKRILCAMVLISALILAPRRAGAEGYTALSSSPVMSALSAQGSKPRVIVEGCTVEGGGLVADTVCEVRLTLRNTSFSESVSSVLVTGRWSVENPPPVDFEESNQAYVSVIEPTQTRDIVFTLKTQAVNMAALDSVPLYLDIEYSYDESPNNTNSVILRIPVSGEAADEYVSATEEIPADEPDAGKPPSGGVRSRQLIFAAGSIFCALIAGILILKRLRR